MKMNHKHELMQNLPRSVLSVMILWGLWGEISGSVVVTSAAEHNIEMQLNYYLFTSKLGFSNCIHILSMPQFKSLFRLILNEIKQRMVYENV